MTFDFSVLALGFLTGISLIAAVGAQNAFLLRHALRGGLPVWPLVALCVASEVGLLLLGVFASGFIMGASPLVMTAITWIGVVFLVAYGCLAAVRAYRGGNALEAGEPGERIRERAVAEPVSVGVGESVPVAVGTGVASRGMTTSRGMSPVDAASGATRSGASGARDATGAPGEQEDVGVPRETELPRGEGRWRSRRSPMLVAMGGMLAFTWLNPHAYLDSVVVLGSLANGHGPLRWSFALGCFVAAIAWFSLIGFGGKALRGWFADARAWRVLDGLIAVFMFGIAAMLVVH